MIESVHVAGIAHYGTEPQVLHELSTFNYLYGANASGKTTISRIIDGKHSFPSCIVTWRGGTSLQTLVYNRDFVSKNFHELAEVPGIFTLGEKNAEILADIQTAKDEVDKVVKKIGQLTNTLRGDDGKGGKTADALTHAELFKGQCWAQKLKHDATLNGAFQGYRSDSAKFMQKVLEEWKSNKAELKSLEYLQGKAAAVFAESASTTTALTMPGFEHILEMEEIAILKK